MNEQPQPNKRPRSSRRRYLDCVRDYRHRRLDEPEDSGKTPPPDAAANPSEAKPADDRRGKRRLYLREYFRWLAPHRFAVVSVLLFAVLVAAFEMIEPLFL